MRSTGRKSCSQDSTDTMETNEVGQSAVVVTQLRTLLKQHVDAFAHANSSLRFNKKHLIGEAMWVWLIDQGLVTESLRKLAEERQVDRKTGPEGHPLWRVAFRRSVRGNEVLDRLFDGSRVGPTPLYARLAAEGLLPEDPADLIKPRSERPEFADIGAGGASLSKSLKYAARSEVTLNTEGSEWVYVYTTARELQVFTEHGIRPVVKVGSTKHHYTDRIAAQAGSTAAHSTLVCLYAYRVSNARELEGLVHRAFKQQDRHIKDAPGVEWFHATPEETDKLVKSSALMIVV